MAVFVHQCPFCDVRLGLDLISAKSTRRGGPALFLHCSACGMASIAVVTLSTDLGTILSKTKDNQAINPYVVSIIGSYPQSSKKAVTPEHIPPEIERVFVQALDALKRSNLDLAAMGFKRSLELALKAAAPDLTGRLGPRVDELTDRHVLTPAMKRWAEDPRVLGGSDADERPEPNAESVEQLYLFVESLLEYLFTLPEKVRQRRARASSRSDRMALVPPAAARPAA